MRTTASPFALPLRFAVTAPRARRSIGSQPRTLRSRRDERVDVTVGGDVVYATPGPR